MRKLLSVVSFVGALALSPALAAADAAPEPATETVTQRVTQDRGTRVQLVRAAVQRSDQTVRNNTRQRLHVPRPPQGERVLVPELDATRGAQAFALLGGMLLLVSSRRRAHA